MKSIKWKHACTARTTTVVLAVLAASTGLGCGDPSSSSPSAPLEDAAVVNGASGASGETRTVTLQPGPEQGKDAVLETYPGYDDVNYGSGAQLAAIAWTADGIPATVRSVLGFDLSSVPKGAVVNSAKLSLYAWDSSSGFDQHSALSGSNAAWLQRITSTWGESTVTWSNPPATTTANQVVLPASTSPTENYLDVDVTAMVQDMVDEPSAGYGMMLRLQDETYYRRLNFCSSDHPNAALRPTLVVTYTFARTVTLQPGPEQGKDAVLETYPGYDDVNFGNGAQLAASAWTAGGIPATVRSVLGFDLSSVPKGAVVNSAKLSLYAWDSSSGLGQHSALSGSNAAWLQRITSSWGESTVTWRNPPTTTTANQVALPASTSPTENYLDIDVTAMVQDMVDDPSAGYGMMLRLQDETYYRRLNFCSSDHPNAALRPTLVVTFSPRDQ